MEMSIALKNESPVFREMPYIPEVHFGWLKNMMEHKRTCFLVDETEGELRGFFLGGLSTYYFNNDVFAEDYTIYVAPDYRGTRIGLRLIKAFEEWARNQGAKHCYLGTNTGIQSGRFVKLLQVLGYGGPGMMLSKEL